MMIGRWGRSAQAAGRADGKAEVRGGEAEAGVGPREPWGSYVPVRILYTSNRPSARSCCLLAGIKCG